MQLLQGSYFIQGGVDSMKKLHFYFVFFFVFILCRAMIDCYRIKGFNYLHVFLLFLAGILLYMLYSLFSSRRLTKLFLLLPAALALMLLYRHEWFLPFWDKYIIQNFNDINLGIYNGTDTHFHQFFPFLSVTVPVTTSVCLLLASKGRSIYSIVIFAAFMFSFWNNGLDSLMSDYIPYFVLLCLLYFCLCSYESTIGRYKSSTSMISINARRIAIYSLIAAAGVTLITASAVHTFGSRSIAQLKTNYEISEMRLENSSRKLLFNLSNTGYGSADGKLGGPVRLDTLAALRVKADHPMYLRGEIKDYYDGHSWSSSIMDFSLLGTQKLSAASPEFSRMLTGSSTRKPLTEKITIYHYGLSTSTLFSPYNAVDVSVREGKAMFSSYDTLMLMGKKPVSEPYTLKYYTSNTGVENFSTARKKSQVFSYKDLEALAADEQYKAYLQVPECISPRTHAMVMRIIKDRTTPEEKVEGIMSYLSQNYPYSLNVSSVPPDTDFVDYFLFSERKGYCTYFASAATIMLRIAGIPARYAEGFNMDDEKDSSGTYIVRNHRAHAWTEVLASPELDLWSIVDCVPHGTDAADIAGNSGYKDKFDDDRYKSGDRRFSDPTAGRFDDLELRYYGSLLRVLFYPLVLLPVLLLLFTAIYTAYRIIKFRRTLKSVLKAEGTVPLYKHLAARLASMGEGFPVECCELEYARSLNDSELSQLLVPVVEACYSECYGGSESLVTIDKKSCNRSFEKHMRRKRGFFRYWYCIIRKF